jgi:O-antigen ligase
MGLLALGLVGVSLITRGPYEEWLSGQRVVGLLGLLPVSWYLTKLYFRVPRSLAAVAVWLGVIILSSSRMATAAAILLLTLVTFLKLWRRRRGVLAAVVLVLCAAGGTAFLFSRVSQFRDHLLVGDTGYIAVRDVGINLAGRGEMWEAVARSARESPIVGKGVGSSYVFLASQFAELNHPHNDYLRLWHDLGLIGLGLFLCALVSWGSILARGWYRAEREGRPAAYTELAGLLTLLSLMLAMVTDNPIVSTYVMAPMGILIGAGLGRGGFRCGNALAESIVMPGERPKQAYQNRVSGDPTPSGPSPRVSRNEPQVRKDVGRCCH